jgi:G3E family GTPase
VGDVNAGKKFESRPTHVFKEILLEGEVSHGHHDDGKGGHTEHGVDAGNFVTFSFQDRGGMDESRFKQFVAELPWELFRMKGPVRFKENTMLINFVGGRSEWVSWEGDEETRLAFIGWDVDSAATLKKLKECLIDL